MTTVNYSVPEKIKAKFNKVFAGENKSRVIAELMQKAIEEKEHRKQRSRLVKDLLKLRDASISISEEAVHRAREYGRP